MDYQTLSSLIGDLYIQLKMKDKENFELQEQNKALKEEYELLKGQFDQIKKV
jgi:hypothetical protein